MSNTSSPITLLETVRHNIGVLFDKYHAATGYAPTFVSQVVMSDRAFFVRLTERGLDVKTYDKFVGRMSGLWPATHPWPDAIPRPAALPLPESGAALLAKREANRASAPPVENWPDDIPQPKTY